MRRRDLDLNAKQVFENQFKCGRACLHNHTPFSDVGSLCVWVDTCAQTNNFGPLSKVWSFSHSHCCCLGAESLLPLRGCQPQLESQRSCWAMRDPPTPEELRWTRVQLGQTLLNALGWLRPDRLARRIRCRRPRSTLHQSRSHMTNQMEVYGRVKMRKKQEIWHSYTFRPCLPHSYASWTHAGSW